MLSPTSPGISRTSTSNSRTVRVADRCVAIDVQQIPKMLVGGRTLIRISEDLVDVDPCDGPQPCDQVAHGLGAVETTDRAVIRDHEHTSAVDRTVPGRGHRDLIRRRAQFQHGVDDQKQHDPHQTREDVHEGVEIEDGCSLARTRLPVHLVHPEALPRRIDRLVPHVYAEEFEVPSYLWQLVEALWPDEKDDVLAFRIKPHLRDSGA